MSRTNVSHKPVVSLAVIRRSAAVGSAGHRSQCLSHAKRPLYHLSYTPRVGELFGPRPRRALGPAVPRSVLPPAPISGGTDCTLGLAFDRQTHRHPVSELHACSRGAAALGCRLPHSAQFVTVPAAFTTVRSAPFGAPAVLNACIGGSRQFDGVAPPRAKPLEFGERVMWALRPHTVPSPTGLGCPTPSQWGWGAPSLPPQQMVRLVFRPYTQVRKAICTSAHLRASTRVSSGFALLRHSSPSFGSQQVCSYSNLSQKIMVGRWCRHRPSHQSGYLRFMGFPPTSSHACYTPWSVFQDG